MQGLHLSLESATLDLIAGKRPVVAIHPDGTIEYEPAHVPTSELGRNIERIWNEYPSGFLNIDETYHAGLSPDATAVEDELVDEKIEEKGQGGMMTHEEMSDIRTHVYSQINDARNELWFLLELSKTLSQSGSFTSNPPLLAGETFHRHPRQQPKKSDVTSVSNALTTAVSMNQGEPPVLPPGTYTTTPGLAVSPPEWKTVSELEKAILARHKAVEECSNMIDSVVEEMRSISDAGDRFWRDIRQLRDGKQGRGRWAIVPKPDFGKTMAVGETARDVVIPYAVDEAPLAQRARCLAAFDLDPEKQDALTFGSRSHMRLKTTVRDTLGEASSSTGTFTSEDVHGIMDEVQMEAFDEDVFNEIRLEALRDPQCTVESNGIQVKAGDAELIFELYDTRHSRPKTVTSPQADLLLHGARLSLLQLYRHRKRQLIAPTIPPPRPTSILQPLIDMITFQQSCTTVLSTLEMLAAPLNKAGFTAGIITRHAVGDPSAGIVERLLLDGGQLKDVGTVYSLDLDGGHGISVNITAPTIVTVTTSSATFPLTNLEDLASILAEDLQDQLPLIAGDSLAEWSQEDGSPGGFFDSLEGLLVIPPEVNIQISFSPPFKAVEAKASGPIGSDISTVYPGERDVRLMDWIRNIAMTVG
ncbi:hypothetical protein M231_00235 [Tremella mesenterica]|uniref:Mediator of RNA polymerase II transcription subunit 17 n=1 Tax=Tremella mesenterica TaxID=5217 RepID=A0A4Q1BWZ5_TREME|nr:hypothetical protein M231_00235 [Tremella mesenterica]